MPASPQPFPTGERQESECENCGSREWETVYLYGGTGVFAPDGYEERQGGDVWRCLVCGHTEEISRG